MEQLWTQLLTVLEGGNLTSDPGYYTRGEAQPGEWAHVIEVMFQRTAPGSPERGQIVDILDQMGFWAPTDDLNFWKNQEVNELDVQDLANAAEERLPEISTSEVGGDVTVRRGTPAEEGQAETGVGRTDNDPTTPDLTILTGEKMNWYFDTQTGEWYVGYGLPDSDREMIFEATPDQMDALFGDDFRPSTYERTTLRNLTNRQGTTYGGNISEMEGTGSFEAEVQRIKTLALDEGRLPDWAQQSGAAMDIIYVAQSEDKSTDWVIDQLAKLPEFKQRFPGVQRFAEDNNLTLAEGITGFLEMEAGVRRAVAATDQDPAIVTPQLVGDLLSAGHSLETVQRTTQEFRRMQQFAPAMEAFNSVLVSSGMEPITDIQDMLDFVGGRAPAELYDLYEASSIQEAAVGAGLGDIFSTTDAIQLARSTGQTRESAEAGFRKAAELILRMRHELDVEKFGLTADELIDINLGQTPRSGRNMAEIGESINRAVQAAQGSLRDRVNPFKAFSRQGTVQSGSLRGLRPQE